jgi:hypothetical protein
VSARWERPIGDDLVLERTHAGLFLADRSLEGQVWPDQGREEARHRPLVEGVFLPHRPEQLRQVVWELHLALQTIHSDKLDTSHRVHGQVVWASWRLAPDLLLELLGTGALGVVERPGGRGRLASFAALGTGADGLLALAELTRALLDFQKAAPEGGKGGAT